MLCTLLDSGISGIRIHRVFFSMQQLGDLSDIGHIGDSALDVK